MAEAAAMFGELVDTTRGQTLGSIVDPLNGQQVSDLASIARLGAIAMVLSVGGIEAALTVVHASYEVCPSAGVILKEQVLTEIVSRVISLAGVALYLASVWLVSFAVVDLGCALMAKVAQGLSFSSCASILKLLATVLLLLHVITSSNSFRARIGRVLWEFHLAAVDRPATGELDG
jgi:type III secretion protein T